MNTWKNKRSRFQLFIKTFSQPWLFLPITYLLLKTLTQANLNKYKVIHNLRPLDFNESLNINLYLISYILFLTIFIFVMTKKFRFDSFYLVVLGPTIDCSSRIADIFYFQGSVSIQVASFLHLAFSSLWCLGIYLPLNVLWSELSKNFVDGFETTGAGCLLGLYNIAVFTNNWVSGKFLEVFDVREGYLERLQSFQIFWISVQILFVTSSVLFFWIKEPRWKVKNKL